MTALMWSAYNGNKEIVELLLNQENIYVSIQNILNQKHS